MTAITRTVWLLSFVSLFTDMASEMLYPVMPVYLQSIGFSVILIGILEGIAEATAGLSKGYFGSMSDGMGKRLPFVRAGYALSAVSKPMLAVYIHPLWVFVSRTIDRFGKGLRTAARDAMLSSEATPATKGRVFGFHRSMDTLGAVIGPLLALTFLALYPGSYQTLFLLAFVPGAVAVAASLLIREKAPVSTQPRKKVRFTDFLRYWKTSPLAYKRLTSSLLLFAVFNSSDVFLLLRAKQSGFSDSAVIGVYIFYNLVYAATSYPIGILADKLGMRRILVTGLALFAVTYIGMAYAHDDVVIVALFLIYGLYAAATEGIAKAWISSICTADTTAVAIGTFASFQSIATMIASTLAGLLWFTFGAEATFILSGCVAAIVGGWIWRDGVTELQSYEVTSDEVQSDE